MSSHEEYKEILAAHALDALDYGTARALEDHLKVCDECRAEFDVWRNTAAAIAYTVQPAMPSTELRSRILEEVRVLSAQSSASKATAEDVDDEKAGEASRSSNVVPLARPVSTRTQARSYRLLAIAASLACIALLASVFVIWRRNAALKNEVAGLSQRLQQTSERLEQTNRELVRVREESDLLNAPALTIASLSGTEAAKSAHARLALDPQTGRAMLFAYDLPRAPAGKAYQLWFIAGGKPVPGKVFNTDARGHATMRDQVPAEARGASLFAITLEPEGGVPAPTGEKVLLGATS
jgi:anti-sigma-K factor RskA